MALNLCGCTHDADDHANGYGHCAVVLPPEPINERPQWACPCRHFTASRTASLLLRSVQSCTVLVTDLGEYTRPVREAALAAVAWAPVTAEAPTGVNPSPVACRSRAPGR